MRLSQKRTKHLDHQNNLLYKISSFFHQGNLLQYFVNYIYEIYEWFVNILLATFYLYPKYRLFELLDQEIYHYRKMVAYKVPLNTDLGSDAKKVQKEEQRRIDEADELTEEEQEEKEDLLLQVYTIMTFPNIQKYISLTIINANL